MSLCALAACGPAPARAAIPGPLTLNHLAEDDTWHTREGPALHLADLALPDDPALRAVLAERARGQRIAPARALGVDRFGRVLARWRTVDSGRWWQGELLRRGLAQASFAAAFAQDHAAHAEAEAAARRDWRGVWGLPRYQPHATATLDADARGFMLWRGQVVAVSGQTMFTYVNFGTDWRVDPSLRVAKRDRTPFKRAGLDLKALAGRWVEVRGTVFAANGPMIELAHPAQCRVLDAA